MNRKKLLSLDQKTNSEKSIGSEICTNSLPVENESWHSPPPGPGPIRVDFKCACLGLSRIDTASLTANIKFVLVFLWNDDRFKGLRINTNDLPGNLWGPDVIFENALPSCRPIYDSFILVDPSSGRMKRTITFHGAIKNPMDLQNFPFDTDDLELKFITNGNWRALDGSRFGNNPTTRIYTLHPIKDEDFFYMNVTEEINEFLIAGWKHDIVIPENIGHGELKTMVFEFKFQIVRNYSFYYRKIFFPLWILYSTSTAAYLLDVEEVGDRFEFLMSVMLSIIGFLHIVQESIPKVGFLTVVDKIVIFSLIAVVASIFFSVIIVNYSGNNKIFMNRIVAWTNVVFYVISNALIVMPAHLKVQQIYSKAQDGKFRKSMSLNDWKSLK